MTGIILDQNLLLSDVAAPVTISWTSNAITFEFNQSVWDSEETKAVARGVILRCTEEFLKKFPGTDDS